MLLIDDHGSALLGHADVWDQTGERIHRAVYSGDVIIHNLIKDCGMTHEEALEFCEYNIEGAYVGPDTPIIVWSADIEELTQEEENA